MKDQRTMTRRWRAWRMLAVALVAGLALAHGAGAWTEDMRGAIQEVAGGKPSEGALRETFANNDTVNRMALRGTQNGGISSEAYVANQNAFREINSRLLREAANQCGLEVDVGPQRSSPLAGTDTDVNFRTRDGKSPTLEQWRKLTEAYNNQVNDFLGRPRGTPVRTNTDIMPDPRTTSPAEFQRITRAINESGGTAYTDPAAARVEMAMANRGPLPVNEVGSYVNELNGLARKHFDAAGKVTAEANALSRALGESHPQVQNLRAEAQLLNSQGAKYVNKINEAGTMIRQQAGARAPSTTEPSSTALMEALRTQRGAETIVHAERIGPLANNALNNATQNTIRDLARLATANAEAAPACHQAMADSLRELPPAQRGQAMEMIQRNHGAQMAREVAKAAQGPNAGTRVMEGAGRVMRVVGPGLMIWDGYQRISNVMEAKEGEERAHAAGVAAGGFLGGLGGATAVGLGAVAILGAPVTAVGAAAVIGVGLVAGAVGYGVGDYAGSSLAGWALSDYRPQDQSVYDAKAAASLLGGSRDIFGQMKAAGIADDVAQSAADAYKRGDIATFRTILSQCRQDLVKNLKKQYANVKLNRPQDLSQTDLEKLLNCLCRASLGANPWVYQAYHPEPGGDSPHCENLGNGPCLASGFGCWRSYIQWNNPGIADCLAAFNVPVGYRRDLDRIYQKPFEKPVELEVTVSPTEFCPGDTLTIEARATGGRGNIQYRYQVGRFLTYGDTADVSSRDPSVLGPTSSGRVTLVAPEARWGTYDGVPIYERGYESYHTHITVWAQGTTWDDQRFEEVPAVVHKRLSVRMRSVRECRELHPPDPPDKKAAAKAPGAAVTKTPAQPPPPPAAPPPVQRGAKEWSFRPTTGSTPPPGASDGSAPPATKSAPDKTESAPPADTKKPAAKKSSWPAAPPDEPETPEPPPDDPDCWVAITGYGTFDEGNTFIGRAREGRRVAIAVVSDTDSAEAEGVGEVSVSLRYVAGDHRITVQDLDQPECMSQETLHVPLVEEPAGEDEAATDRDCHECLSIGGSTQQSASSLTLADGTSESTLSVSQTYYVEGCPGDRVRISVKGSDGWSDSAEAVDAPAAVTRTFTTDSGVDTVTAENLSIRDCSLTFERPFGPPQTDLRGAEAPASDDAITGSGTRVLESVVGSKAARAGQRSDAGVMGMAVQRELQRASTSGDQQARAAQQTLDLTGQAIQDSREDAQRRIKAEDAQSAHVMSTAIMEGIGSGLAAGGARFGSGVGERAAGEIFDRKTKKAEPPPASPAPSAAGSAPASGQRVTSKTDGSGKPAADKPTTQTKSKPQTASGSAPAEAAPAATPVILADALCPVCGEMYNPNQPHQCAGAPKPAAVQTLACEVCGKTPATAVTTVDGGRMTLCNACQAHHRCPRCGKITSEFTGGSFAYGYTLPDGSTTNRWARISGVCPACLRKWKQEQGVK